MGFLDFLFRGQQPSQGQVPEDYLSQLPQWAGGTRLSAPTAVPRRRRAPQPAAAQATQGEELGPPAPIQGTIPGPQGGKAGGGPLESLARILGFILPALSGAALGAKAPFIGPLAGLMAGGTAGFFGDRARQDTRAKQAAVLAQQALENSYKKENLELNKRKTSAYEELAGARADKLNRGGSGGGGQGTGNLKLQGDYVDMDRIAETVGGRADVPDEELAAAAVGTVFNPFITGSSVFGPQRELDPTAMNNLRFNYTKYLQNAARNPRRGSVVPRLNLNVPSPPGDGDASF